MGWLIFRGTMILSANKLGSEEDSSDNKEEEKPGIEYEKGVTRRTKKKKKSLNDSLMVSREEKPW